MATRSETSSVKRGAVAGALALLVAGLWPGMGATQQAASDPVEQRLQQLEEQMVDLQVVIGTLQSFVQAQTGEPGGAAPGAGAPAPAARDDLSARVDAIETQIHALTGQIEQLTAQLGQLTATAPPRLPETAEQDQPGVPAAQERADDPSSRPAMRAVDRTPRFGTLTVTPDAEPQAPAAAPKDTPAPAATPPQDQVVALDPKTMYEQAYGHLIQRDYQAAETAFRQFLQTHPSDALAGNAQYWLGETYYVRGKYSEAANAFLDGYKQYRSSNKAPDSLLKLGMALYQLGERDAACATFAELSAKFPKAPAHIQQRAASEQQRAGC